MSLTDELSDFLAKPQKGDPFNPRAWAPRESFELRFEREFQQFTSTPILRQHVFAKAQGRTLRGIWWSLVWGYPRGKQAGDDKSLKIAMSDLANMAYVVDVLRNKTPEADKLLNSLNGARKGLSTASTTKIAYFAGLQTTQGPALIFDQQAATAIIERNDPEFAPLLQSAPFARYAGKHRDVRVTTALRRTEHYREYLAHMYKLSDDMGVAADDIERFLYEWGRKVRTREGTEKSKITKAIKKAPALVDES